MRKLTGSKDQKQINKSEKNLASLRTVKIIYEIQISQYNAWIETDTVFAIIVIRHKISADDLLVSSQGNTTPYTKGYNTSYGGDLLRMVP